MTKLDRFLHRQKNVFMWIFTGLVVSSVAFTILKPPPSIDDAKDKKKERKKDKKKKTSGDDVDNVDKWSRKRLFAYLSEHQVYPDVDLDHDELVRLVKGVQYLH